MKRFYQVINKKDNHLYKKVFSHLEPRKDDRVLEIGCGRGFLTREIQRFSKNTIGIDLNPKAVSQGVAPNLRIMDGANLEFPADYFDKIYSCHTIEHVPDLKRLFREIERVLRPGGRVLLVYPWEMFRGMGAVGASPLPHPASAKVKRRGNRKKNTLILVMISISPF